MCVTVCDTHMIYINLDERSLVDVLLSTLMIMIVNSREIGEVIWP